MTIHHHNLHAVLLVKPSLQLLLHILTPAKGHEYPLFISSTSSSSLCIVISTPYSRPVIDKHLSSKGQSERAAHNSIATSFDSFICLPKLHQEQSRRINSNTRNPRQTRNTSPSLRARLSDLRNNDIVIDILPANYGLVPSQHAWKSPFVCRPFPLTMSHHWTLLPHSSIEDPLRQDQNIVAQSSWYRSTLTRVSSWSFEYKY